MNWFLFWLTLHILAAIVAFGATFAFPFLGARGEGRPDHLAFAVGVIDLIAQRLVLPLGGTMLISGVGLIGAGNINLFQTPWLIAGMILYLALMGVASAVQLPTGHRVVNLLAEASPGPPPAEALALVRRLRTVGMMMAVALLAIVVLMVVHPGGTTYR